MTTEHKIQNEIRCALSEYCIIFRGNVGKAFTKDGRYFDTGLPKGFSDLFGVRKADGRAVFIEVKAAKGKVSKYQENFIMQMQNAGAIAGICRSAEEAIKIVKGGDSDDKSETEKLSLNVQRTETNNTEN